MAVTVSLNGLRVTDVRLQIPAWGASYADVTLDGEHTVTGSTALVVSDLTLQCTVLSGGPAIGRSYYRVVAGAGGWGKSLKKRSYSNDAGVKLLTVLTDAASECGETFDTSTIDSSIRLGSYFVRPADLACRLLEQLAPNAWYVGEDGKTRLGARPSTTPSSTLPVTSQVDLAQARVTLASDTIASILPGLTVSDVTAVDVEHTVSSKDGVRSTLWGQIGAGTSRRLAAFRAIIDQLFPNLKFQGTFEYRVVTQSGERLNLQCVRASTGMPDVQSVLPRPGIPGAKGEPALGSRVLVRFIGGDPTNPVVTHFESAEAGPGAFLPTKVTIDAKDSAHMFPHAGSVDIGASASSVVIGGGTLPVARQGDPVTSFFPPNLPITGTVGGSPIPPGTTITILNSISGVITSGSSVTKTK